jgi:hypothetical protein
MSGKARRMSCRRTVGARAQSSMRSFTDRHGGICTRKRSKKRGAGEVDGGCDRTSWSIAHESPHGQTHPNLAVLVKPILASSSSQSPYSTAPVPSDSPVVH